MRGEVSRGLGALVARGGGLRTPPGAMHLRGCESKRGEGVVVVICAYAQGTFIHGEGR